MKQLFKTALYQCPVCGNKNTETYKISSGKKKDKTAYMTLCNCKQWNVLHKELNFDQCTHGAEFRPAFKNKKWILRNCHVCKFTEFKTVAHLQEPDLYAPVIEDL